MLYTEAVEIFCTPSVEYRVGEKVEWEGEVVEVIDLLGSSISVQASDGCRYCLSTDTQGLKRVSEPSTETATPQATSVSKLAELCPCRAVTLLIEVPEFAEAANELAEDVAERLRSHKERFPDGKAYVWKKPQHSVELWLAVGHILKTSGADVVVEMSGIGIVGNGVSQRM